jgi:energy-coupling factor transporter ATP-binding protein EcfA2
MRLDFVEYCEDKGKPSEWRLEGCQLGNVNLIVGKNASGKSRILRSIKFLSDFLSGEEKLSRLDGRLREWKLTFDSYNGDNKKVYILKVENSLVIEESYTVGSKCWLMRDKSGKGKIWAKQLEKEIDFQTPTNEVAAFHRRDSIQHPFFDKVYTWASLLRYYEFGTDLGRSSLDVINTESVAIIKKNIDFKNKDHVIRIFKLGEKELGESFIESIKSDMLLVGYRIDEIGTKTPSTSIFQEDNSYFPEVKQQYIYVQESDLKDKTEQSIISQGMFRVLSLIIQINYSLLAKKPSCILIDDIGEGLDFERSSAMVKLLISKAQTGLVQLIMTTNDRFIMNGVPLEYWSVIERKSGLAKLHNIHNSKEIFDDFKFTGLNNFDFFATQFYIEGFGNEENIEE